MVVGQAAYSRDAEREADQAAIRIMKDAGIPPRVMVTFFQKLATLDEDRERSTMGIALASHGLKAGTRALLNTSPEPASNWVASVAEDTVVVGGLALVMAHPWIALLVVVGASLLGALLVWWVWRTLSRGVRRLFAPPPPA